MSHASAPSSNDEAIYAEVLETSAKKFSMDENVCYEGIKPCSTKLTGYKKENSLAQYQACKRVLFVLMIALLLLLGTICTCIAFAVEISKLKSEMSFLRMESASQQSLNALENELENLTQQLNASVISLNQHSLQMESASQQSLNALETALEILTQQLNASVISLNQHSLQIESASQQSLNALETELENLTQQLNVSVMLFNKQQSQSHNILDEKIELLNSSSQILTQQLNASVVSLNQHSLQMESASQQSLNALETALENLTQQLTASVMLFNKQQSKGHNILDEKIELLNSSSQEQFMQLLELNSNTQLLLNTLPSSCAALPPTSSSGYYWIKPSIGSPPVQVYCDFNRQCGCGGSSPWTRVAFLNMSDPNEVCPSNWTTYTSPVRACGTGDSAGISEQCDSVMYPNTMGQTYSRVCGRVIAYQHRDTRGFLFLVAHNRTLEQQYLDGVSITHGSAGSRQHVWSFASTMGDIWVSSYPRFTCSCSRRNWPYSTSFVGNDYFCDTGNHGYGNTNDPLPDDPLWDGDGCDPSSTCCTFNNPPWFCKTLPQPTTDDLEVRICEERAYRDTPIQLMEIYVQ